jgi:hypothetical protein
VEERGKNASINDAQGHREQAGDGDQPSQDTTDDADSPADESQAQNDAPASAEGGGHEACETHVLLLPIVMSGVTEMRRGQPTRSPPEDYRASDLG